MVNDLMHTTFALQRRIDESSRYVAATQRGYSDLQGSADADTEESPIPENNLQRFELSETKSGHFPTNMN